MNFDIYATQVVLYTWYMTFASGSIIIFDGTPAEISDGLTSSGTLRCSLNDTVDTGSSSNVIGRRDVISRRDVTQTAHNVQQVSSIIIMKDGTDIASITQAFPAKILNGSGDMHVTGDVSIRPGERGYLTVTWHNPGASQAGEYVCEVNAINDVGHNVMFTQALEVGIKTPTLADLISHVRDMEAASNQRLQQLEADRDSLRQRVEQLEMEKASLSHTETGYVECKNSAGWTGRHFFEGKTDTTMDVTKTFARPYATPPVVKVGVVSLDAPTEGMNAGHSTRYYVSVTRVDTAGFTVRCATWSDTNIVRIGVSWISVPDGI